MAIKNGFENLDELNKEGKSSSRMKVYRSCYGKTLFLAQIGKEPLENGLNSSERISIAQGLTQSRSHSSKTTSRCSSIHTTTEESRSTSDDDLCAPRVVFKKDGPSLKFPSGKIRADPVSPSQTPPPHLGNDQAAKPLGTAFQGDALNVLIASMPLTRRRMTRTSVKNKTPILLMLKEKYGIEEEDFASAELEIVPAGPARHLGLDKSMILGYGHDDRVCAFATIKAMFDAKGIPNRTRAAVICDKEEIGSYGQTGMDSTFMENTVAELVNLTQDTYSDLQVRRALERSNMLSADVCALHDPAFGDVSSPNNMPKINCGVALIKYTGSRGKGGSSDASAEFVSQVRKIFNDNKVIWQMGELGKVDVGGGGTIAYILPGTE